jgi:S-DNA-T family DNA segregation ATPase FtsK/SpoIIIE
MTRNKKERSGATPTRNSGVGGRIKHLNTWERIGGILAILLFFFSVYLLVSFTSFFISGGADISHLDVTIKELFTNPDLKFQNSGGRWGALLAYLFINKGFGISAVGFIYLLVIIALRLSKIGKFSFRRNFGYTLFLIIWTSVASGYFFTSLYENSFLLPGGAYGYFISHLLNLTIGKIGTFFLILASLLICIIIAFEEAWPIIKKWLTYKRLSRDSKKVEILGDGSFPIPKAPLIAGKETAFAKVAVGDNVEIVYAGSKENDLFEIEREEIHREEPNQITGRQRERIIQRKNQEDDGLFEGAGEDMPDFDPTLELSRYIFPPIELLEERSTGNPQVSDEELIANKNKIIQTLKNYSIEILKIKATTGPTITLYEIIPAPGVRVSRIKNLEDDIALSLAAYGIRIIAPIPGKGTVGIEVPNSKPEIVSMRSLIDRKSVV